MRPCTFKDQVGSKANPLEELLFSVLGEEENLARSLAIYQVQ